MLNEEDSVALSTLGCKGTEFSRETFPERRFRPLRLPPARAARCDPPSFFAVTCWCPGLPTALRRRLLPRGARHRSEELSFMRVLFRFFVAVYAFSFVDAPTVSAQSLNRIEVS